jgi:predicted nucleic acid-binding protein
LVTTAVDTNILLDLLIPDAPELQSSYLRLSAALEIGPVILSELVYAELAPRFSHEDELNQFLEETAVSLVRSQPATFFRAGRAWLEYLRRRSNVLQCPQCGSLQEVRCQECSNVLRLRQHLIADFLIGAHALLQADALLTRDRGYYAAYFPDLTIV